ncbi:hypothetical protein LSH36_217g03042 [Paralvinella palmiformis]|uniref:Death domain-containing protein n=1 Tax=Paralvinella palmiformis TaxID=53620 RepID=A0AAD9JPK5_9ANNE|nr:hypothetical protein LSH36_217g03042 [Paralvinella palmiformis]
MTKEVTAKHKKNQRAWKKYKEAGYPRSYHLNFYRDELKYRDKSPCHNEVLNEKSFCGLICGTKNSESKDCYLALMFMTFTIIITLEDNDKKQSVVQTCKNLFQDIFGSYKSCRIKFEHYPKNEKKRFMKECTGYVLLSVTKHRVSICSETFFHVCLYTWYHNEVTMEFELPNVKLEISTEKNHPGLYIFHSEKCLILKQSLSQIRGMNIYESVVSSQTLPSFNQSTSQSLSSSSTSSQQSTPLTPPRKLTAGSLSLTEAPPWPAQPLDTPESNFRSSNCGMSSTSSGSVFEYDQDIEDIYMTTHSSTSDYDLEFSFDINDYISKNRESVMQALGSFCCKDLVKPTAAGLESNNVVLDKTDFCMRCMSLKSLVLNESNLTSEKDYLRLNTFYDVCDKFSFWVKQRSPGRDTLQLKQLVRFKLCTRLYAETSFVNGCYKEDWEVLAEDIGICSSAIGLIRIGVKKSFLPYPAAEIVIRHWQFMYNRYGTTIPSGKCPIACTTEELLKILNRLKRSDLVELIKSNSCPSVEKESEQ